ncbi:hypothetical protein ACFTXM_46450 [Streptomyces sp. NPDC056930]|uniref:hypothetical protein n=1 Tax=Streptomyces sp. NPDC056930 TaxID=3345967 RepID=UPI00363EFDA5
MGALQARGKLAERPDQRCGASFKAVAAAAVATAAELGPLCIAVNCTGPGPAHRTVSKEGPYSLDMFNRIVQVNLIGTFNMIRLAAAEMTKTEEVESERGGERVPARRRSGLCRCPHHPQGSPLRHHSGGRGSPLSRRSAA